MGGQFGNIIAVDRAYQKWVKQYKMLYVETQGMKKTLNSVGVNNVSVFPNCRVRPSADIAVRPRSKTLKCVCFSMIYPEKGIDIALEAATRLPKVSFDFWGPVREDYRNEFLSAVDRLSNCTYNGVFQVDGDNVYSVLNQYDLLLFPTRLTGEGVPGTLIEAKIAALPTVVSNVAYNAELVKDGVNGIVLKENNSVCLADVIESMDADDAALMRIKQGALDSGSAYYFDEYITNLLAELGVKS
jgi:glycosyltransferase involved in cell wall biosynthesis